MTTQQISFDVESGDVESIVRIVRRAQADYPGTYDVTPSRDDPKFGFGKRPSKATILEGRNQKQTFPEVTR